MRDRSFSKLFIERESLFLDCRNAPLLAPKAKGGKCVVGNRGTLLGLDAYLSSSKRIRLRAPKSSSCNGLRMADARFEKLCASNGISVLLTQSARSRNFRLHSLMSPFLN